MSSLHRQTITAGLVAFFVAIPWLDFAVDPDLSLFALYLIPIIYAGWFLCRGWGYACCMVSGLIWMAAE